MIALHQRQLEVVRLSSHSTHVRQFLETQIKFIVVTIWTEMLNVAIYKIIWFLSKIFSLFFNKILYTYFNYGKCVYIIYILYRLYLYNNMYYFRFTHIFPILLTVLVIVTFVIIVSIICCFLCPFCTVYKRRQINMTSKHEHLIHLLT